MKNNLFVKYFRHGTKQAGTSLIEVLIYITILGLIITSSLMATYQILSGSESLSSKNIVEEEASFIIAKINWALNNVSAINSPVLPNTSDPILSVNKNGFGLNPIVITSNGDNVTIKKGANPPVVLNSAWIKITNLNFDYIQQTGASTTDSIKAYFHANGKYFEIVKFIR